MKLDFNLIKNMFYSMRNVDIELPVLDAVGYRLSDSHILFIRQEKKSSYFESIVPENDLSMFYKELAEDLGVKAAELNNVELSDIWLAWRNPSNNENGSKNQHLLLRQAATIIVQNHKIEKKNRLIHSLNSAQNSLSSVISSANEYTHSDLCSIWVHNSYTEYQVCIASDKEMLVGQHLSPKDPNNKIYNFLRSEKLYERAPTDDRATYSLAPDGMKSMTRFRINLGNNTVGVFSFGSRFDNYYIRQETGDVVAALAVNAYQIEHRPVSDSVLGFSSILRETPGEDIATLGNAVCEKVAGLLDFEACSLYLTNDRKLDLVASCDCEGPIQQIDHSYSQDERSLTVKVMKDCKVHWSYRIEDEKLSKNGYSEKCELPATNWIGLPIKNDQGDAIGVLRVKNKYRILNGTKLIAPLRFSDFTLLMSVVNALEFRVDMYSSRIELIKKIETQKNNLLEFQDHQRILLHEFRAPAHAFMNTPEEIRDLVVESQANSREKETISREIGDLLIVADRLDFIIKCHRREHLFSNIKSQRLYVLQDVVMPVVSTYQRYLKKQWDLEIKIDLSFLSSRFIIGDSDLLSVVMNILLDNAGKYSKSKKNIRIYGELDRDHDMVRIYIQNDGYEILENESSLVFEDSFRGSNVKKLNIDGTGIGLNLAKDILARLNSKIYIVSRKDPVIIAIELPEDRT